MKIGIISDLHIAYDSMPELSKAKEPALESLLEEIDCLVMCGDNAEPDDKLDNTRRLFGLLRDNSKIPIGFITGNHCHFGYRLASGIAYDEIKKGFDKYSEIARDFEIIHLEDQNMQVEGITIGGTYGHHDGSLAKIDFKEDYQTVKRLLDAASTRLDVPETKLFITHTVPNKTLIGRPDSPAQDQYTPYAGSFQLEEAIKQIKPKWHFCGHTHAYADAQIDGTQSFNVGTDYTNFFYMIVNTLDSSVIRLEKKLNLTT